MGDANNLRLVVEDDDGNRSVVALSPGEITLGRAADNVVQLPDRNVSRHHAKLVLGADGAGHAEDLGSYNGVFVNGARIEGKSPLRPGDVVRLGDVQLELRHNAPTAMGDEPTQRQNLLGPETTQPEGKAAGARQLGEESTLPDGGPRPLVGEPTVPSGAQGGGAAGGSAAAPDPAGTGATPQAPYAKLLCLGAPRLGVAFELTRHETHFGRTGESHVALDHPSISRQHASVRFDTTGYVVRDLASANGTLVNGSAVTERVLAFGDVVELGQVRLRLVAPGEVPTLTVGEQAQALAEARASLKRPRSAALAVGAGAAAVGVVALAFGLVRRPPPKAPVPAPKLSVEDMARGGGADEGRSLLAQAQQALTARQYARAGALASAALALDPRDAKPDFVAQAQALAERAGVEERGEQALAAAKAAANLRNWPDAFNALQGVPQSSSFAGEAATVLAQVRPALVQDRLAEAKESADGHDWDEVELLVQEVAALSPDAAAQAETQRLREALADGRRRGNGSKGASKKSDASAHAGHGGRGDEPSSRGHGGAEDAKALYAEGTRALAQGQLQRAIDGFNRCLVADKGYAMCYRALGIAYAKGGSGAKAARFYRLYLKVDPNARDASQVRALLQQYNSSQADASEGGGTVPER